MIIFALILAKISSRSMTGNNFNNELKSLFRLTCPMKDTITWQYRNLWIQTRSGTRKIGTVKLASVYFVIGRQSIFIMIHSPQLSPAYLVLNSTVCVWFLIWKIWSGTSFLCLGFKCMDQQVLFVVIRLHKKTVMPDYTLKNHKYFYYYLCIEVVSDYIVKVSKKRTETNPYELFTKMFKQAKRVFMLYHSIYWEPWFCPKWRFQGIVVLSLVKFRQDFMEQSLQGWNSRM